MLRNRQVILYSRMVSSQKIYCKEVAIHVSQYNYHCHGPTSAVQLPFIFQNPIFYYSYLAPLLYMHMRWD